MTEVAPDMAERTGEHAPFLLPYLEIEPSIGRIEHCGANVSLLGRLTIGAGGWFGPGSVVRGDGHFVEIGDDFRLGERGTLHISHEMYSVVVGHRVAAGRNAVVHACTVGDDCVIGDDAVVLDGAVLEAGVVVEAGSTVFPRTMLPSGWLYAGSPAKPVRELKAGEIQQRRRAIEAAILSATLATRPASNARVADDAFVADTADLRGDVRVGDRTGVFFGCRLAATGGAIDIAEDCNVQDNSFIDTAHGPLTIGAGTTIGHNVDMQSGRVGSRSLIGIGSKLGAGTIVDDDTMLAGGATTLPGQHLETGWLWAGRPARPLARLDDAKRAMIALTVEHYRMYGVAYAAAQRARRTAA